MKQLNIILMGMYLLMNKSVYSQQEYIKTTDTAIDSSMQISNYFDTIPVPSLAEILLGHVFGIDVSHHNGYINWQAVVDSNPDLGFVIIKATEGGDMVDVQYHENFFAIRKQGIMVGAYHFYNPEKHFLEQVKNFTKTVKLKPGDMVPVLDLEKIPRSKHAKKHLSSGIKNWLLHIEKHYGVKPMIYTNQKFLREYLADLDLSEYPAWIAAYSYQSFAKDIVQASAIHQFSASLSLSGLKKPVDANRLKPEHLPKITIPQSLVELP